MKRFLFFLLALSFLWRIPDDGLYAQDVQDLPVTVDVHEDYVEYSGTLIHTGAATDNVFSQAIDLTGLLTEGSTVQFRSTVGVSGRDVNLFIEGSNTKKDTTFESYQTRTEWEDFSPDLGGDEATFLLDRSFFANTAIASIGTIQNSPANGFVSAVADSDGTVISVVTSGKDLALCCRYVRFKSDGQSGNGATVATAFVARFMKNPFHRLTKTQYQNSVYDVD